MLKTLKAAKNELTLPEKQIAILNGKFFSDGLLSTFEERLFMEGFDSLHPVQPEIFQVNVGYMCNQVCKHCHVDAGPDRKEIMEQSIMELCLDKIMEFKSTTVDITGGAPEMNPKFRWFVEEIRKTSVKEIIVRSNLTIIISNPKYKDLPEFFRENEIRLISSLPFYSAVKTNRQRGEGVFEKSILALQLLNASGYGRENKLKLDLVYNPGGAFLPGDQAGLEMEFKKVLKINYGVDFNSLFALTNLPINRFLDYLIVSGNYEDYMEKLVCSFNPKAVENLMCRNTLSIDYQGYVYDCDFNQMLGLKVDTMKGAHLSELDPLALNSRNILTGQHCFGCTAGAGSSCQGSIAI